MPDDVWIVGYDDIDMASWESFDLTTARQPVGEMAGTAVDLLLDRIAHPQRPATHQRFRSEVVVRGSTAGTSFP